jgi:hypothetical protein
MTPVPRSRRPRCSSPTTVLTASQPPTNRATRYAVSALSVAPSSIRKLVTSRRLIRQRSADTQRTHQKRHARRLATGATAGCRERASAPSGEGLRLASARRRPRTTVTVTMSAPATPTKKTKDEKTIVIKTSGFIGRGPRRRCAHPCRHKRSIPSSRAPFSYCQRRRAHPAGLSGSGPISTATRLHGPSPPEPAGDRTGASPARHGDRPRCMRHGRELVP